MIVVYGGAFNPPTKAHYEIAKTICQQLQPKAFVFLPVGDQYEKADLAPATHRIKMLQLLANKLPKATVSTLEVQSPRVLTTYESLSTLQHNQPDESYAFVIGADNLAQLPLWSQSESLLHDFKLIVLKRDGQDVEALIMKYFKMYASQFIVLDGFAELNLSSTMYRTNLNASSVCLHEVDAYVHQFKLYGRGE